MPRQIAVGFVTYYPSDAAISRMRVAADSGFAIYVFDNSPDNSALREFCNVNANCRYFTCGKNVGLGFGISTVCAHAYYDSYPALLFFDQDTVFNQDTLNFVELFYCANEALASTHSALVFNSKACDKPGSAQHGAIRNVRLAISSGSLFLLSNLKKLNWHNDKYFVDWVDYEFCLRSAINNLAIGEYSCTPGFDHRAEQDDVRYKICGSLYLLRAYSLRRFVDTMHAGAKLILLSSLKGKWFFTAMFVRLLTLYVVSQAMVRILNLTGCKEEGPGK